MPASNGFSGSRGALSYKRPPPQPRAVASELTFNLQIELKQEKKKKKRDSTQLNSTSRTDGHKPR